MKFLVFSSIVFSVRRHHPEGVPAQRRRVQNPLRQEPLRLRVGPGAG